MNKWESHKECVLSSGVGVGYQINTERAEVMIFTKEKKKNRVDGWYKSAQGEEISSIGPITLLSVCEKGQEEGLPALSHTHTLHHYPISMLTISPSFPPSSRKQEPLCFCLYFPIPISRDHLPPTPSFIALLSSYLVEHPFYFIFKIINKFPFFFGRGGGGGWGSYRHGHGLSSCSGE